jgi:hypothetical protein
MVGLLQLTGMPQAIPNTVTEDVRFVLTVSAGNPIICVAKYGVATQIASGLGTRAVQRSIYDTHSEDGTDAAKGDAMASVCDIVNAIEAQDVGGERAQACKDAGIASDAAGVFCEATVADVVIAVLDAPVVADGLGALSGWQHGVADEQRSFAG